MTRVHKKNYYARKFLNHQGHHGLAAIMAVVDTSVDSQTFDVSGALSITDCVWCNGEIPAAFGCGCDCHENVHYECSQDNRPERAPR